MTNDAMQTRLLKALDQAIAQRGKTKGMLKAKCPPMGTDGAIMWQALMMHANPYKLSSAHILHGALADPEFVDACNAFAKERSNVLARLDRDRVALERLGVW